MLRICRERMPEAEFWHRPNTACNSVGNLLIHLSGNLGQYVISGLGDEPDRRERPLEFLPQTERSPREVWDQFFAVLRESISIIESAPEVSFLTRRRVQGFDLSGVGMALHAVEHLSYHTGQIAYILKSLTGTPLQFYDGMDLNQTND